MTTLRARRLALGPRIVMIALIVAAAAACGNEADQGGSGAGEDPAAQVDIEGRTFVSTAVEGRDLVPGTRIRLAFQDDRMAASAGCNTMTGHYRYDGTNLAWDGPVASTMMGCPDDLSAQDQWLTEILSAGVEVTPGVGGDELVLATEGERITMVERPDSGASGRGADPAAPRTDAGGPVGATPRPADRTGLRRSTS